MLHPLGVDEQNQNGVTHNERKHDQKSATASAGVVRPVTGKPIRKPSHLQTSKQ
jgi:hypothetical protein